MLANLKRKKEAWEEGRRKKKKEEEEERRKGELVKMEKKLEKNKDDEEENEHLLRMITAEKLIQDLSDKNKTKEDLLKFREELLEEMEEVMKGEALYKNYWRLQEIKDKVDIFVDRKIEYWRDENYYYFLTPQPRKRKSGPYMATFDKVLDVDVLDKGGKFTLAAEKGGEKYKKLNRPWLEHLTEEEQGEVTDKLFYLEKFMYEARTTGRAVNLAGYDERYAKHRREKAKDPWVHSYDELGGQKMRNVFTGEIKKSDLRGGRRRKTRRKRRRRRRKSTKKRRRKRNLKKRTGRRKSKRRRRR